MFVNAVPFRLFARQNPAALGAHVHVLLLQDTLSKLATGTEVPWGIASLTEKLYPPFAGPLRALGTGSATTAKRTPICVAFSASLNSQRNRPASITPNSIRISNGRTSANS